MTTFILPLLLQLGMVFNADLNKLAGHEANSKIIPGSRVGVLSIGDTRERIISVLGKKKEDEEYTYTDPCNYTEIHWLDLETHSNGLFFYLRKGRVFQIDVATPRYSTMDGISVEAPDDLIKSKCLNCDTYVLLHSGSKVVGGQDLMYLVNAQKGIAFELYYNKAERKRRVSKIIVFEPKTDFTPEGCIAPPKKLRKLLR